MKQIFVAITLFLLSFSPIFALNSSNQDLPATANEKAKQKKSTPTIKNEQDATATISASPTSDVTESTPSADQSEATSSTQPEPSLTPTPPTSPLAKFFESETNRAATLFTLAVVLILIGFIAGKRSSNYSFEDESEE